LIGCFKPFYDLEWLSRSEQSIMHLIVIVDPMPPVQLRTEFASLES